ncbi:MAG TPA: GNAT family N-acetyltransferase [Acidimicrobiia bacterium]|nr:GNAT family N-acetyltransferase [Acidimicrobiia bacterium]
MRLKRFARAKSVSPAGPDWLNRLMFEPIRTERLIIRSFQMDDVEGFLRRRNDPEVAEYQDWELPFTLERAVKVVSEAVEMGGPRNDEWWMAAVSQARSGEVLGDLALHLGWQGRSAEIGYTFDTAHWAKGYAVESVSALIEYLFETLGVTRVFGMLHPDNTASAQVLERCGLLFEGHTRSSFWLGDECSDDWIYGMTRPDWDDWVSRPRQPADEVRLDEVTLQNNEAVFGLRTHKSQEAFVATMAESFADALFPEEVDGAPVVPWMRAVVADGDVVGFVMLAVTTPHHPEPFLWRLLIDRRHQRRGIGGEVLRLVGDECRAMGDSTLLTSWTEGRGSPRPFYLKQGFVPTGHLVEDETEARLTLT